MPRDDQRLSLHQARCTEIYKQAYLQRLSEENARFPELEKKAAGMGGYELTPTLQPGQAVLGGLAGAGVGAGAAQAAGLEDPLQKALAIGGPALVSAMLAGHVQKTLPQMEQDMIRRQAVMQAHQLADSYAPQVSGAEL
jgi:hypothetical protein